MTYKYKYFRTENSAPLGAERILVYRDGKQVGWIPLGKLSRPNTEPLYRFAVFADIHLSMNDQTSYYKSYSYSNYKFDKALKYLKSIGCKVCIISGDITVTGAYRRTVEDDDSTSYIDLQQFEAYRQICKNNPDVKVYSLMGNHEHYYGKNIATIDTSMDYMEDYFGRRDFLYTLDTHDDADIKYDGDLFILCGQPYDTRVVSDSDFERLRAILEANTDKRCYVFVHGYIEEDSGDPLDVRENSIFQYWSNAKRGGHVKYAQDDFINLLSKYPNVILFHGHSHMKYELQKYDVNANYSDRNGFKSVHVSSLASPRDIKFTYTKPDGSVTDVFEPDQSGNLGDLTKKEAHGDGSASEGCIVEVYEDCIIVNGIDFVNGSDHTSPQLDEAALPVVQPIAIYKLPKINHKG